MNKEEQEKKILQDVYSELEKAEKKFPGFPTDPIHASTVVAEELGELQKAVFQWSYEGGDKEEVYKEAIQTSAMSLRFLFRLKYMEPRPNFDITKDN